MTLPIDETVGEYTDALKTEDRVRTLEGFYEGRDASTIGDDIGVSTETADTYLDEFDELGFLDRDAGTVTELGEYVQEVGEEYGADDVAALFGTVSDDVGRSVLEEVASDGDVSMSEIAADHGVAAQTASSRYDALEAAGFADSSRKRRWKTYDLTEKGEEAVERLEEFAEYVDEHGAVDTLDMLAQEVGTVTEEQRDVSHDRVVEEDGFEPEQTTFGYEGWDEGQ